MPAHLSHISERQTRQTEIREPGPRIKHRPQLEADTATLLDTTITGSEPEFLTSPLHLTDTATLLNTTITSSEPEFLTCTPPNPSSPVLEQ